MRAAANIFGEGRRKIHSRLRLEGIRISNDRVRRIRRTNQRLSLVRAPSVRVQRVQDGATLTEEPDGKSGADHAVTATLEPGRGFVFVFAVVDQDTAEALEGNAAKQPTRFEAVEPRSRTFAAASAHELRRLAPAMTLWQRIRPRVC
jgi:hypothetical protein